MPRSLLGELFRYLRRESASAGQEFSDGALLERFLDQRDEVAFENLVKRHGPMVLGVCQRVVGDTHAAEDAFQATFFVLARKAGSIRNQASVGSWLFGVAQRIASKARAQAATRRDRERRAADMPHVDKLDELTWQELRSILDEEIGRLPTKYQAAVVLCHLEGKSYDHAAQELGCPKSTLATRLAKALDLLRGQLTRRGLALSAGALATALTEKATAAPVAALVSINIMKAATSVAAGKPLAAGILSTQAIALAEEAMKTMIGIKMKLVAMVLALGLAVGVGYAGYSALLEQPPPKVDEKQPPVAKEQPAKKDPAGPTKFLPAAWLNVGPVRFAAFLPDGKQVVTASYDGNIRVWEYPAGKEVRRIAMPESSVKGMLALSTDGKMIAAAKLDETEIYLYDLATGKQMHALQWALPKAKKGFFDNPRLAFSPNGEHLAALDRAGAVSFWDPATGKEIRKFTTGEGLGGLGLVYAPDGKSILTINDKPGLIRNAMVKIWDPATEKEKCTFDKLPSSMILAASFSPDSKTFAICCQRDILIADTATGKRIHTLTTEVQTSVTTGGLIFGKDGAKLYYPFVDKIVEYEVATGKVLRQQRLRAGDISLSPDSNTLLAAGNRLRLLDLSGKEIASLLDDSDTANAEAHAYAVKLVERYGGKVLRDDKQPGKPVIGVSLSGGPGGFNPSKNKGGFPTSWPAEVLKELKQFKQLASLDFSNCRGVYGRGFSELKELKELTTLDLRGTQVNDAGLKELKELNQLTTLDLRFTKVTDKGLKELKELKLLTKLYIGRTEVTDAGVKELPEALPKCNINNDASIPPQKSGAAQGDEADAVKLVENLGGKITRDDTQPGKPVIGVYLARNTKVTDADLKRLKEFKHLTTLDLKFTKVTDDGLKELKEIKQLTKLYIGGTQVTDTGLKELKELKQLTTLGLGATKVSDKGLKELKELKQLQELILISCSQVTDAGVQELQEALPKCKINR